MLLTYPYSTVYLLISALQSYAFMTLTCKSPLLRKWLEIEQVPCLHLAINWHMLPAINHVLLTLILEVH